MELGATGIAPSGSATDPSGVKTDGVNKLYLPPYLYAARRDGKLAYGLSVNAPFGLGTSLAQRATRIASRWSRRRSRRSR